MLPAAKFTVLSNNRLEKDLRPARCARRSRPLSLGVRQPIRLMKRVTFALIVGFLASGTVSAAGQDLIAVAKGVSVASLDSNLPAVPLERWLGYLCPPAAIKWEVNDCGEGGDGLQAPTCVEAILDLGGDTTAHASISLLDVEGKRVTPGVWDLSIGAGYSFTGFKTLHQWAEQIRKHVR
jgi:hypothetical protein